MLYAQTLGTTLSTIKELQGTISCIYCSRLQRCIQTAYEVAKILNVPIFISTGLAQTAKAIEQLDVKIVFNFYLLQKSENCITKLNGIVAMNHTIKME